MNELFLTVGIFIFVTGLCIGSFLNVVICRAFSGESIVYPPSKCPKCGSGIKPYDNIPVLSYLILGGKCRNCKEPVSIQYPLVELLTGVLFLAAYLITGETLIYASSLREVLFLPWVLTIISLSVVIAATDIKEQVVFDVHSISLIAIILLYKICFGMWFDTLTGLLAGVVGMELLNAVGFLFVRKRAFGTGDTMICASIGALLGAKMFAVALLLAVIIQALCVIPAVCKKLLDDKNYSVLISAGIFSICAVGTKIFQADNIANILLTIVTIISGIFLCFKIPNAKSFKENPMYLPFGPALLVSMLVVFFFGDHILQMFFNFIR